ncbi:MULTISPECIES: MFS transporter [Plantibacter]|uniref:MFS transporter n=1 Tax=Plantibacter TaxID=190323 RepID=UPI0018D9F403|nr:MULTISPECIES: MFS transporter [Plantibacter]
MTSSVSAGTTRKPQIRLVLGAVFVIYLGQMTLNPIIAPLAREVGLAEWQVGVTISTAALTLVLTSQYWGRRSQSAGRKPVLVMAFAIATVATVLFAVVAWLGITGALAGTVLFLLFLALRGVGFGAAIAAVPPTAQAYIADVTSDEAARVKGMVGVGAVQGMAMIGGAAVGGTPVGLDLLAPLIAVPILLGAGLVLLALRLRPEQRHVLISAPARVSPRDTRIWPFLVAGFGMFTALGFIHVVIGFLVEDRLGLGSAMTGVVTGCALLAVGFGLIVAQAAIVPRIGWSPAALLRVGSIVALLGFVVLVPDLGTVPLVVAILLVGLGLGIASPGYTAGPSLLLRREEQGGLAGLIGGDQRPHVRRRTHGRYRALRRVAPAPGDRRCRDIGDRRCVRNDPSTISPREKFTHLTPAQAKRCQRKCAPLSCRPSSSSPKRTGTTPWQST